MEGAYMPHPVQVYSLKYDGDVKLGKNFRLHEFQCSDNSDVVFIDEELIDILQKVRDYFNKPVVINSGYRTVSYNKKVEGSAGYSKHCMGLAADVCIDGVKPIEIARYVDTLNKTELGIILYPTFVHIDTRYKKYRGVANEADANWYK